jgi:hypothetical protein
MEIKHRDLAKEQAEVIRHGTHEPWLKHQPKPKGGDGPEPSEKAK